MDKWRQLRHSMKIDWWTLHDDQSSRNDGASSGRSILNQMDAT